MKLEELVNADDWSIVERELTTWMRHLAGNKLIYRGPNQAIPGHTSDGFRSDGLITNGSTLIALEVEFSQTHPDTNVGKYWLFAEQYSKIILFHVYTPKYGSYPWRKKLGEFYADMMAVSTGFEYRQLDERRAGSVQSTLDEVKRAMEPVIVSVFGELLGR